MCIQAILAHAYKGQYTIYLVELEKMWISQYQS